MAEYFIVTKEVSKDDLKVLHRDGLVAQQRKRIQCGEIGLKVEKAAPFACVVLAMMDGAQHGAEALLHVDYVEKISDYIAGLLLPLADTTVRLATFRSPVQMGAAMEIVIGSAVVYTRTRYTKCTELVGMVVSIGKNKDYLGTWFGVELFGPKSEVRDTEMKKQQLVLNPTLPKLVKVWDLVLYKGLQGLANAVQHDRINRQLGRSPRAAGVVTRSQSAAMQAGAAPVADVADPVAEKKRMCVITRRGDLVAGVIRWKGTTEHHGEVVGLEMDEELRPQEVEDVLHLGKELFSCPDGKRIFVPSKCLVPLELLHNAETSASQVRRNSASPPGQSRETLPLQSHVCILLRNNELASGVVMWKGQHAGTGDRLLVGLKMDKEIHHDQLENVLIVAGKLPQVDLNRRVFCDADELLPYDTLDAPKQQPELGRRNEDNVVVGQPVRSTVAAPNATDEEQIIRMEMQGFGQSEDEVVREQEKIFAKIEDARAAKVADTNVHEQQQRLVDVVERRSAGREPELSVLEKMSPNELAAQKRAMENHERQRRSQEETSRMKLNQETRERSHVPDVSNVIRSHDSESRHGDNPRHCDRIDGRVNQGAASPRRDNRLDGGHTTVASAFSNDPGGPSIKNNPDPDLEGFQVVDFPEVALRLHDRVNVIVGGMECSGNLMYLGQPSSSSEHEMAGIELDEEFSASGNSYGEYEGVKLFECTGNKRAVFVKSSVCHPAVVLSAAARAGGPVAEHKDALLAYGEIIRKGQTHEWSFLLASFRLTVRDLRVKGILRKDDSDEDHLYALLFHVVSLDPPLTLRHFMMGLVDAGLEGVAALVEKEARKDGRLADGQSILGGTQSVPPVSSPPSVRSATVVSASAATITAPPGFTGENPSSILYTNTATPGVRLANTTHNGSVSTRNVSQTRSVNAAGVAPRTSTASSSSTVPAAPRSVSSSARSTQSSTTSRAVAPPSNTSSTSVHAASGGYPSGSGRGVDGHSYVSEMAERQQRQPKPRSEKVAGEIPPPQRLPEEFIGWNCGIQGEHNSCYMDSSLFAMFFQSMVFDDQLHRELPLDDSIRNRDLYEQVQSELKYSIVNPLRKNGFVSQYHILKLRKLLKTLISGIQSAEKDPEEYLTFLWEKVLQVKPFLSISSDVHSDTSYMYQMFVSRNPKWPLPNLQQLLEESFSDCKLKLSRMPKVFILQLPRHGREFKVYDQIAPTFTLRLSNVLEGGHISCVACDGNNEVVWRCYECSVENVFHYLCAECEIKAHCGGRSSSHSPVRVESQKPANSLLTANLETMELFAVVCINLSHYVTFVKCGTDDSAKWCFFDSMADREEPRGREPYNLPRIISMDNLMSQAKRAIQRKPFSMANMSPEMKRLFNDPYICFYQCTGLLMASSQFLSSEKSPSFV